MGHLPRTKTFPTFLFLYITPFAQLCLANEYLFNWVELLIAFIYFLMLTIEVKYYFSFKFLNEDKIKKEFLYDFKI